MKKKDRQDIIDLVEGMGYSVPAWNEGGGIPMPGMQGTQSAIAPDGSVVVTETVTLTLIKQTTYPAKA